MRPATFLVRGTMSAAVSNSIYIPDHYISPMNVALSTRVSGTINYSVQYTFDDVFAQNYNPTTGNWTEHPTLKSLAVSGDSNIAYPVTGIRVVGNSGSGEVLLTVIQAGGGGLA